MHSLGPDTVFILRKSVLFWFVLCSGIPLQCLLGIEWAGSGKLQTAGESSFSGTFAAVNETHALHGCQLLLQS